MINLSPLFQRDLQRLQKEISSYTKEELLWVKAEGIHNSGGNLCLHLVGNLNTYIGATLGNSGYIRDREAEFSGKTTQEDLVQKVEDTQTLVCSIVESLTGSDLEQIYPDNVLGYPMTTEYFLIHLVGHLNYHLGQINYHRRLLAT